MMKKNQVSLAIFLGFLFVLFAFPLVLMRGESTVIASDGDDDVDGVLTSQNFNNEASFTDFDLSAVSGGATVNSNEQLIPQETYEIMIEVSDPDTIRDLRSLEVRFYNSEVTTDGVTPSVVSSDFNSATSVGIDGQEYVVKWERNTSGFSLVSPAGTHTWSLTSIAVPTTETELNRTSFQFKFEMTISKVAPETPDESSSLRWYVGSIVKDGWNSLTDNGTTDDPTTTAEALTLSSGYSASSASYWKMAWYGEISVADSSISWLDLPAGVTFGSINFNVSTSIGGINFISNGNYDSQIRNKYSHWDAVMTQDLANDLFVDFDAGDFSLFNDAYALSYSALQAEPLNFKLPTLVTINTPSALVGIPFEVINIIAQRLTSAGGARSWTNYEVLLPESIEGANLTGANIVTNNAILTEMFGTDDQALSYHQHFAIAYKNPGYVVSSVVTATAISDSYYLIGSESNTEWRSFQDEDKVFLHTDKPNENGHSSHLDLYIALSPIYQNARYEGTIQLKITDPTSR